MVALWYDDDNMKVHSLWVQISWWILQYYLTINLVRKIKFLGIFNKTWGALSCITGQNIFIRLRLRYIYYSGYTLLVHILKLVMPIAPLTILEKYFSPDGNRWRPPSTAIWIICSLLYHYGAPAKGESAYVYDAPCMCISTKFCVFLHL